MERHCLFMNRRLNTAKTTILLHLIYRVNTIFPSKFQLVFRKKIDKWILKFIQKFKGPRIAKTNLKKKNKAQGFTLPGFKIYYKARVNKTAYTGCGNLRENHKVRGGWAAWYWHKDDHRTMDSK